MNIKAIIFDLDGTIADTIPLTIHSLKEVTRELTGKEYSDEDIMKEFGPIDTKIIKKLVDNEWREESEERYIEHFSKHFKQFVRPMEGITELLQFIKEKGIKVGLFTGRSLRAAEIILDKLNIRERFDVIIAGDATENPKPNPEGIYKALEMLKVNNSEGMYVGDFDVDVMASKAAGTTSVLALWSSTGDKRLIDLKPHHYFKSPYEFIEWLKQVI